MDTLSNPLPRLLYIGDVPVESSYHGSALLYRLLQNYPVNHLQIVEAGLEASLPERRLKDVLYHFRLLPFTRLQNTRFSKWYTGANLILAKSRVRTIRTILKKFKPEAILTVTHGASWITAARMAQREKLPLHLICHDEWGTSFSALPFMKNWMERVFGDYYRTAASRLCVSPYMAETYEKRFGGIGRVLYPSRAIGATVMKNPPERLRKPKRGLVCAYAGSVNSTDYRRILKLLAECLESCGGKLLIFGLSTFEEAEALGWAHPNMQFQGLVDSQKLIFRLREEADVLFIPMSFASEDRANMEISFPSKLTDYTAVGLPLLICGPPYCSAVRWANENPGVAEVIENADAASLNSAVHRLVGNPDHLTSLGLRAIEVGERFFSPEKVWQIFRDALTQRAAS